MKRSPIALLGAALLASAAYGQAFAADPYVPEPEYIEPAPVYYEPAPVADAGFGSWYIRGDVMYGFSNKMGDITYRTPTGENSFTETELDSSWGIGGAIGANVHKHFRTEVGLDWYKKFDFRGSTTGFCGTPAIACTSDDSSKVSILTIMANAYVDLGTYYGFTAYAGAGLGGARVKWDTLYNDDGTTVTPHDGYAEWRFAWQLMAGASYCLTEDFEADIGYRYRQIEGGRMFAFNTFNGPGYDEGIRSHEVRAGLRYNFGGANPRCKTYVPPAPPLPPAPPPIYK